MRRGAVVLVAAVLLLSGCAPVAVRCPWNIGDALMMPSWHMYEVCR